MNLNLNDNKIRSLLFQGNFGLEKESLRIDSKGYLAHTKHPFLNHKNIEKDFCENQTEIITKVCDSIEGAYQNLLDLHRYAKNIMNQIKTGREIFWPFSNPPYIRNEREVMIASYQGELKGKEVYREYLAEKYGKRKMLFSGIHFNFSFSDELLKYSYQGKEGLSFEEYKDQCYLNLAARLTEYSWLIVYLMSASPVMDGSYFDDMEIGNTIAPGFSSARCSEIGYWNDFMPLLDYDSLASYVESIQGYVDHGQLKVPAELYYPVRLKSSGENSLEELLRSGVNHLEFRLLDLNPYAECGIFLEDLKFLQYLIGYLFCQDAQEFGYSEQSSALKNIKNAAKYEESAIWIDLGWNQKLLVRDAAMNVLMALERFYAKWEDPSIRTIIQKQKNKIMLEENRYAYKVKQDFGEDFVKQGLEHAKNL